ncbi:hypothetical protein XENORESO_012717 [Xenotaenia resolanae]|uniref:Uncharacterized protein n=1 Tax=Xenotaenia resolanae TaxID=208358 RepID=A0ABV0WEC8_9TELE
MFRGIQMFAGSRTDRLQIFSSDTLSETSAEKMICDLFKVAASQDFLLTCVLLSTSFSLWFPETMQHRTAWSAMDCSQCHRFLFCNGKSIDIAFELFHIFSL